MTAMKVHVLQHVPFEGLGAIEPWLRARNAEVAYTRFFESEALPAVDDIDFVIAMGGPMSVNDEIELPWLAAEKRFVASVIHSGKSVLGVCLGAQLMAAALGSRVYPGPQKEIGWFDIASPPAEGQITGETFRFPDRLKVFHWHGETFDVPTGAARLASSPVCANQAMQIGRRAIGLQFHLETTPETAAALIENCRNELVPGDYIQTELQMRSAPPEHYAAVNRVLNELLEYLTRDDH